MVEVTDDEEEEIIEPIIEVNEIPAEEIVYLRLGNTDFSALPILVSYDNVQLYGLEDLISGLENFAM